MSTHHRYVSAKKGMLPGSAVYIGEHAPKPTTFSVSDYSEQQLNSSHRYEREVLADSIEAGNRLWIDINGLQDVAAITALLKDFNIHPLVIEDIFNTEQRSKIDVFDDYLFIVLKQLAIEEAVDVLQSEQFCLIMKDQILITIRENKSQQFHNLLQKLSTNPSQIRSKGSDYLMYLLMDTIVDGYFHLVEKISVQMQQIEEMLLDQSEGITTRELYVLKRQVIKVRKALSPLRDIINILMTDVDMITFRKHHLYLKDLYDHCLRLLEEADYQREMVNGLIEMHLSIQGNRLNETMKILTVFASIFIPLTFIAGLYGMNFSNMPELQSHYGYPAVLLVMFVIALMMVGYFKHKKIL